MICPTCRHENPRQFSYCSECGSFLESPDASAQHGEPRDDATEMMDTVGGLLASGSTFAGRYKVIEELGRGGMGRVYKVHDSKIGEKIALKLLRPEACLDRKALERFSNELKLARMIRHKNVCQMFDLGEAQGSSYITMEYVRGEDLRQLVMKVERLSPGQAVAIIRQVCAGLEEAHRLGVVHRDLKPRNIMVDEDGNARIMDFGIARSLIGKGITDAGAFIGTPEYMSPEQVEGGAVDERSDIYALGVILYDVLTGRCPFDGDTPMSIAYKHRYENPKNPRELVAEIPDALAQIILRCLEKDKTARYQNVRALDTALAGIELHLPAVEKVVPKRKSLATKNVTITLNARKFVMPALIVTAMIALLAVFFVHPDRPVPPTGKTKLAVLPFENLGLSEDEYFADGITDEIIARLTGVSKLGVIARTSSMQYKRTDKSIKQIGEELGVQYIVAGTIRWQKDDVGPGRVRVTPTLIRAEDSTQLWANVYDESLTKIFQVQSDISRKLVDALGIALARREEQSLEARPTVSMEAYDYYLRGLDFVYSGTTMEKNNRLAIEMFERSISIDPDFYLAHAQLASLHANTYWLLFDRSSERIKKAEEAVNRALSIDSGAPAVQTALGNYYYHCKLDYDRALEHFSMALRRQPNNTATMTGIGRVKRRQARMAEAVESLKAAAELDPRSCEIAYDLGVTYALLRDYREAERWFDRTIFLNSEFEFAYLLKARFCLLQGEPQRARQTLEEASRAMGRLDPDLQFLWVSIDLFEGAYQEALDRLSSISAEAASSHLGYIPKDLLLARIFGLMKNDSKEMSSYQAALMHLEKKIEENPTDSRYHSALGMAYAGLGRKAEAARAARKATEIMPISLDAVRGIYRAADLAEIYTMIGEYDEAFNQIESLLSIPGIMSIPWLMTDPIWAPLRSQPRFNKLVSAYQDKEA